MALKYDKIDQVIWGLDPYSFIQDIETNRYALPEYFYDDNPFNEIRYILNKGAFTRSIGVIKRAIAGEPNTDRDMAYNWMNRFGDNFVVEKVLKRHAKIRPEKPAKPQPDDFFMENAKANMAHNILPIIRDNPDIEFEIFFPPYSILYWDTMVSEGTLEAMIALERYIIETFLTYDNVKMHYMQNNAEIICNIENYMDYAHYHPDINVMIIEAMGKETYLLTEENYQDMLDEMYQLAISYDYDALFIGIE